MNSIINTTFILISILFSTICIAESENKLWYAGVTTGLSDSDSNVNNEDFKYGLLVGYKLKEWLSIEAEITRYKTNNKRYSDSYSNSYVNFTQQYKFAFMGMRATKYLGDVFGFTARLGAGYTTYKSTFERESMLKVSSAVGMLWRIKDFTITNELQQVTYPIANSRNENDVSVNLSLKYRF